MNELELASYPVIIKTEYGDLVLKIEDNKLMVYLPTDLKIGIVGDLDIKLTGDFNIESLGEINLLSRKKNINIDSLGANIFLNSYRSKQIRYNRYYKGLRTRQLKQIEQRKLECEKIEKIEQHYNIDDLVDAIIKLNERVTKLETLGPIINHESD